MSSFIFGLPPPLLYGLVGLGTVSVARTVFSVLRLVHRLYLHQSKLPLYLEPDSRGRTSWALITGASDGIGLEFAHQLCARGANIVLHGRNSVKLNKVQDTLRAKYPNRGVQVCVADAGKANVRDEIEEIAKLVQDLPDGGRLRILINNVGGANAGISGPMCQRFMDLGLENIDTLININARFPTLLTAALLPIMTIDDTPSLIINMSSMAGIATLPYLVIYDACKAYNLHFSSSLGAEMIAEGKKVESLGIITGSVDTPGSPRDDQGSPIIIEPNAFVHAALGAIGSSPRVQSVGLLHTIAKLLTTISPEGPMIAKMKGNFQYQQRKSKSI